MSASVRLEAGDMFRYYSQATVNLKKHLLSQTFSIWGGEKKKKGGEKNKVFGNLPLFVWIKILINSWFSPGSSQESAAHGI